MTRLIVLLFLDQLGHTFVQLQIRKLAIERGKADRKRLDWTHRVLHCHKFEELLETVKVAR